jgi:hypothetical protein
MTPQGQADKLIREFGSNELALKCVEMLHSVDTGYQKQWWIDVQNILTNNK